MDKIQSFEKIVPIEVDIDKLRTVFNQVVVEFDPKENEKTASGIYTPSTSEVNTIAEHANRKGIVVKVPEYLYFNKKDPSYSMRWKTDMQLKVGDEVWMNHLTMNDFQYRCNGKKYRTILYEDIIVAKRKNEVIMLNGYVLLEPHFITRKVLQYDKKFLIKTRGTVSYLGKENQDYTVGEYVQLGKSVYRKDPKGLRAGDKIFFTRKALKMLRPLEYSVYNKFDGKPYFVAQRHMIACKYEE